MMIFALLVALAQTDPAPADPVPAPAATPAPAAADDAHPVPAAPMPAPRTPNANQIEHQLRKLRGAAPGEAVDIINEIQRGLPQVDQDKLKAIQAGKSPAQPGQAGTPMGATAPPPLPEVVNYLALPETEQVKYAARDFFSQLIAGDARRVALACAFPFQLEDRRLANGEELFQELLRNLRTKRTDLLTLYDIEVLSAPDMEKKYGKPPTRLSGLQWRAPHTFVAVANLSGHAAVAMFRQEGTRWAAVGYHD